MAQTCILRIPGSSLDHVTGKMTINDDVSKFWKEAIVTNLKMLFE